MGSAIHCCNSREKELEQKADEDSMSLQKPIKKSIMKTEYVKEHDG